MIARIENTIGLNKHKKVLKSKMEIEMSQPKWQKTEKACKNKIILFLHAFLWQSSGHCECTKILLTNMRQNTWGSTQVSYFFQFGSKTALCCQKATCLEPIPFYFCWNYNCKDTFTMQLQLNNLTIIRHFDKNYFDKNLRKILFLFLFLSRFLWS